MYIFDSLAKIITDWPSRNSELTPTEYLDKRSVWQPLKNAGAIYYLIISFLITIVVVRQLLCLALPLTWNWSKHDWIEHVDFSEFMGASTTPHPTKLLTVDDNVPYTDGYQQVIYSSTVGFRTCGKKQVLLSVKKRPGFLISINSHQSISTQLHAWNLTNRYPMTKKTIIYYIYML